MKSTKQIVSALDAIEKDRLSKAAIEDDRWRLALTVARHVLRWVADIEDDTLVPYDPILLLLGESCDEIRRDMSASEK